MKGRWMAPRNIWPLTALAGCLCGAITAIVLFTDGTDTTIATALVSILGSLLSGVWAASHADRQVGDFHERVDRVSVAAHGRIDDVTSRVGEIAAAVPPSGPTPRPRTELDTEGQA
jgi:hypothetical protein